MTAGTRLDPPLVTSPLGDAALVVRTGHAFDERTRLRVAAVAHALLAAAIPDVTDIVPGLTTVTVHYDPVAVAARRDKSPGTLFRVIDEAVLRAIASLAPDDEALHAAPLVEIPVCYGADLGPDLDEVAGHAGLQPFEVIDRHVAPEYRVHMIGFMPGFPYLGGLDPSLATPRRATPRPRVPAGAVGIGGAQTGVYPLSTPGGWQLIGQTPVRLFDPRWADPTRLHAGDRVRFVAIERGEFDRLATEAR